MAGPLANSLSSYLEEAEKLSSPEDALETGKEWAEALAGAGPILRWVPRSSPGLEAPDQLGGVLEASAPPECTVSVDIPSTGSLGNISPLVVPFQVLACARDVFVPKMSSDGSVTGTIDILESIGFNSNLDLKTYCGIVYENRTANIAQTRELAFADGLVMAARRERKLMDVPALVFGSIVGKKIATGCRNVVIDVKVGKSISKLSSSDSWEANFEETRKIAEAFSSKWSSHFDSLCWHVPATAETSATYALSELACVGRLVCLLRAYTILANSAPEDALRTRCDELRETALSKADSGGPAAPVDFSRQADLFRCFLKQQHGNADVLDELVDEFTGLLRVADAGGCLVSAFMDLLQAASRKLGCPNPDEGSVVPFELAVPQSNAIPDLALSFRRALGILNRPSAGWRHTASIVIPKLCNPQMGEKVRGIIAGPPHLLPFAMAELGEVVNFYDESSLGLSH
jgi:hypothetical protein